MPALTWRLRCRKVSTAIFTTTRIKMSATDGSGEFRMTGSKERLRTGKAETILQFDL